MGDMSVFSRENLAEGQGDRGFAMGNCSQVMEHIAIHAQSFGRENDLWAFRKGLLKYFHL